jgi:transposase
MGKEFDGLYAKTGRPSIPPERLLRALLLQIFYSVRSERLLMEQLSYNLLFRWFVGMEMDEPVWNHAVFSKNRERLLNQDVARAFFARVLAQAKPHLSDEHFTVDGTLIGAWASQKSFQKKNGGEGDGSQFRGDKRTNDTHESKTDPDAKLYRKGNGQEARLGYLGHVMMENRNGLIVDAMVTQADGTAERDAGLIMAYRRWRKNRRRGPRAPISVGADKAYDTRDFVKTLREMGIRPHVAQNLNRPERQRGGPADRQTQRLPDQPEEAAADREGIWLDETKQRNPQNQTARLMEGWMAVPDDGRGFQSLAPSQATDGGSVGECAKR